MTTLEHNGKISDLKQLFLAKASSYFDERIADMGHPDSTAMDMSILIKRARALFLGEHKTIR